MSRVVPTAWEIARDPIRQFPSADDFLPDDEEESGRRFRPNKKPALPRVFLNHSHLAVTDVDAQ